MHYKRKYQIEKSREIQLPFILCLRVLFWTRLLSLSPFLFMLIWTISGSDFVCTRSNRWTWTCYIKYLPHISLALLIFISQTLAHQTSHLYNRLPSILSGSQYLRETTVRSYWRCQGLQSLMHILFNLFQYLEVKTAFRCLNPIA
jgi:hypothetical protein